MRILYSFQKAGGADQVHTNSLDQYHLICLGRLHRCVFQQFPPLNTGVSWPSVAPHVVESGRRLCSPKATVDPAV